QVLRDLREMESMSLVSRIERVLELTHYSEYLDRTDAASAEERRSNLDELMSAAHDAEVLFAQLDRAGLSTSSPGVDDPPADPLSRFLERIALMSDLDDWDEVRDKVTLMTLHAAKGLEFDHVMIPAVEDSILPHTRFDGDTDLDEERRLLYVGITRARRTVRLYYSSYRRLYNQNEPRRPSPFLQDISGDGLVFEQSMDDLYGGDFEPSGRRGGWGRGADSWAGSGRYDEFDDADFGDPWDDGALEILPGARLEHDLLGVGVVEAMSGLGHSRRITVRFEEHGRLQILGNENFRIISGPDFEDHA
ncbi:MAG: ATP-binding domain-containing protein, partial [Planctomycetes bacterium]|nr:ATP-binding domain-containing protein [Planctomycetota bacterium]